MQIDRTCHNHCDEKADPPRKGGTNTVQHIHLAIGIGLKPNSGTGAR